ncbi:MAG: glutaredoxin domain-containing protein [Rhodococcus sp. (in: high G+C Gram-positive bacteria)]
MRNGKQWVGAALAAVAGFTLVTFGNIASSIVVMVLVVVFLLALTTPVLFPRSLSDDASQVLATEKSLPQIYWRPGCIFCLRLRVMLLLRAKKAVWTSIAKDPAAAARVRSVNDGNETVPTVFTRSEHRTNPSPSWVVEQFA